MKFKVRDEKIMGYILIIAGVCLVVYGVVLVFSISQGFGVPIDMFNANYEATDINPPLNGNRHNVSTPNAYLEQMFIPLFPLFNFMMWITMMTIQ